MPSRLAGDEAADGPAAAAAAARAAADPGDIPVILDLTRLVSRLGLGPLTGIDRVEAAWIRLLADRPHWFLARIRRQQLLLPASAGPALLGWLAADENGTGADGVGHDGMSEGPGRRIPLPPPDLIDRLRRRTGLRARAERALRGMALARCPADGRGLALAAARLLHGRGPDRVAYLNVGHSNLDAALWRHLGFARRVLLVHDTIPLDYPQWTRAGQSARFAKRLAAGLAHADLIVAISAATADDVARWRPRLGITRQAPILVAPIGTTLAPARPDEVPPGLPLTRPYYVTIGTIEPRKNHALLLDAWDRLDPATAPVLLIIGRRGWAEPSLLARLDALPPGGPVIELSGLSDGAVAALLSGARGLLMPSRAEGFGLPLTEAAARGVPVVTAPLPAVTEFLGGHATVLPADDPTAWAIFLEHNLSISPADSQRIAIPRWEDHAEIIWKGLRGRSVPR